MAWVARPAAEELYQIIVGPMAEDLRQAKAQTLMWSLDGTLRYLPLAALYDGKQYLIEQYRIENRRDRLLAVLVWL